MHGESFTVYKSGSSKEVEYIMNRDTDVPSLLNQLQAIPCVLMVKRCSGQKL